MDKFQVLKGDGSKQAEFVVHALFATINSDLESAPGIACKM